MKSRYRLTPEAQLDVLAIRDYHLKQGGAPLARHVLDELLAGFRRLATRPGSGHQRPDLTDEPVKFWRIFSYLIVYDASTRPIGTARVLHASRDLHSLFSETPPKA